MKKENIALKILKIRATYLAGCLLWLLIFSTFMPADENGATTEPFQGAICAFGIITATILLLIVNYNSMQHAYQKTKAASSNIKVFKDKTTRLLEKANKVADKYMTHEEKVQVGVADKRTKKARYIRNAQEFQLQLENYPDLKANQSIMTLLEQIKETENAYAQVKVNYNYYVEYYNTLIHSFPNSIFRKILKFNDAEFYNDEEENEITDEELGI